jgi:hypothetical protein
LLVVIGTAGMFACTARGPGQIADLPVPDPRVLCDTIPNSHRCAMAMERDLLPLATPYVTRSGDTLTLRLMDESTHRLIDGECCEGDPLSHHFVGFLAPIDSYVVHGQFYEGDTYFIVDRRTGGSVIAWGRPVLSPDSERVAAASGDIEAGYNPNGFQIWRVHEAGVLELEWGFQPTDWGPQHLEWVDPKTIRFTGYSWCGETGRTGFCVAEGALQRDGTDWIVSELRLDAP